MKIKKWDGPKEQRSHIGNHSWSVPRLFELSKDLPIMEVPLDHLYVWHSYESLSLRDMVMHMQAVFDADLSHPIILDEDGVIMDGRHRVMKALLTEQKTIKVVRFDENPDPCRIDEDEK
jgi:hypothetical protein